MGKKGGKEVTEIVRERGENERNGGGVLNGKRKGWETENAKGVKKVKIGVEKEE
jgi:hypothetical protein